MSKSYLVCIDSDGCAFDTMEIKHKECFCPSYIDHFQLQAVSKYARDAWDFANLYSSWRGVHRLRALLKALEVLSLRKEVSERNFTPPTLPFLKEYVASGQVLSNGGLEEYLKEHPECEEFRTILKWSYDVNERIAQMVHGVPPFPYMRESLEKMSQVADVVIVSATPYEALEREWKEHGLLPYVTKIEGQESGTKKEIIAAWKNRYPEGHVLMIGDAPGDLEAAHANGVYFYPICPDKEAKSWEEFDSVFSAFVSETYGQGMETEKIAYFETLLPAKPAWLE